MADQLPIISETLAINASATVSTSFLGRGLAAIQNGKLPVSDKYTEEDLVPALSRVMNAAFRMGHLTFKENAKYVLNTICEEFGKMASDSITICNLQAAYINSSNISSNNGASSTKEVANIESIEELYLDKELSSSSHLQVLSRDEIPKAFDREIYRDGLIAAISHIKAGKKSFAEYTHAMITELGENIRPYLRSIYHGVRLYPGFDNSGMDDYKSIENTTMILDNQMKKGMTRQQILEVLQYIKRTRLQATQKPNSQPTSENKSNETNKPPNQHD